MNNSATGSRHLEVSAWLLVATQVLHGLIPDDASSEGYLGAIAGLFLILAAGVGVYLIRVDSPKAGALVGWTGALVAAGFVFYHLLPIRSPITNPYPGESVGFLAWLGAALPVGAGTYAIFVARSLHRVEE